MNRPKTIFCDLDGTLVKTLKKDDDSMTSLSWDMKNEQNISIASGFYIFHVKSPGIGEKIIKWFGVQKVLDLETSSKLSLSKLTRFL